MNEILEKKAQECIESIEEEVREGLTRRRGDAVAFAMGYFQDNGVVPIKVLKFINNLYYDGKIEE